MCKHTCTCAHNHGSKNVLSLSCSQHFVTPSTVAHQALLSMELSRQEYWSGLPFASPGSKNSRANTKYMFYLLNNGEKTLNSSNASKTWFVLFSRSVVSTLFAPMDCSTSGFPVHQQLPELSQTHVHRVSDTIQPSHPLSSPSPPALDFSQQQGFFK